MRRRLIEINALIEDAPTKDALVAHASFGKKGGEKKEAQQGAVEKAERKDTTADYEEAAMAR